jgi:polyphosphate kinase 1
METKFFNRELSWIEFNARVLYLALNRNIPLVERLQFLAIVSSNFDEFFQVRVASIKRMLLTDPQQRDVSGLTPEMQLKQISARAHQVIRRQHECLMSDIMPSLSDAGLVYVPPAVYTPRQNEFALSMFVNEIYPLLTPLRTDTEEFPHIGNMTLHAAFLLKPIEGIQSASEELKGRDDVPRIALVPVPAGLSRVVWLPSDKAKEKQFALLDDIIEKYGTRLFPGFAVEERMFFKVARDADFSVDEDSGSNFIHAMEDVLVQRQSSFAVQISCSGEGNTILPFLMQKFGLAEDDVYKTDGILDPGALLELRNTDEGAKLSYPEWQHYYPVDLPEKETYWDTLKQHDVLLHVPYESYQPVIKYISDAADDPDVLAIKMTLYRTGRDSPIIPALERAARNGKQVTVLVELKARFDEERNIAWANELEKAGAIVIYGLVNLKVHAKILMVIRRESDSVIRYVHIATGNYNPKTAKLYSDLSLFTANPEIANDATSFFNLVTGYSTLQTMKHLSMAPVMMKSRILAMIRREIDRTKAGSPGLIIAKMNSLTHEEIITALYKASCAGVRIMLNVRGICMLVPGVKGMSENIKVVSIVDRYLEHSRIFYFQNGGNPELFLSSADWMSRNLDRRVELMFPILDPHVFVEVKGILDTYFEDNTNSHTLEATGAWMPNEPAQDEPLKRAQELLYKKYRRRAERASKEVKIEFKVRRKN